MLVPNEGLTTQTLVQLADTLVDDFDVVDLLTLLADRCVAILAVSAAGLMLADPNGELRVVASSSDAMRVLETFEVQSDEGPCPDCYRSGRAIVNLEIAEAMARWPHFAPRALEAGFTSVHALPMHLRSRTIGALNLFRAEVGPLTQDDLITAQALADMATIAILQHRVVLDAKALNDQMSHALNSRIVIEQAKGIVGEHLRIDMERSFNQLRAYARSHNLRLADVARDVISGDLRPETL